MSREWSSEDIQRLKELRLDPIVNSPGKLEDLVRHFKGPKPSVFAVTEGSGGVQVSKGLARKVRDFTQSGSLDWLLHREGGGITGLEGGGSPLSTVSGYPHDFRSCATK